MTTPDTGRSMAADALPVTLFDYGVGNLHSIAKALESAGAAVTITRDPAALLDADAIVLPGVGAFGACMEPLQPYAEGLRDHILANTPCLAVCIGMHLLFEGSSESPGVAGLGVFRGEAEAIPASVGKVPHMGWNTLHPPVSLPHWDNRSGLGLGWRDMLPGGETAHVYYVHSYQVRPVEPVTLLATTYGPEEASGGPAPGAVEFAAVVARGNTLATQFHPEKSSGIGLEIVARWVRAAREYLEGTPREQNLDTLSPRRSSGGPQ